jgi:uncharacterized protein YndB with AHSA1/START domain
MPRVENEVIIKAAVDKVFGFVCQPSNLPLIWPSLMKITNEQLLPNGGYSYRWTYKMAGMHLEGTGKCIDIMPNLLLTSQNAGPIDSTVTFTFRSKGVLTKVTLTIDYHLPFALLGRLAEITIVKMNDKEAELILDNLRITFEES